ncbi:hypothetical protein H6F67_04765 [Microcoleus sp. FACHB-1515]|uniref:hypothetical protein n=1 Tax=Cyanophyceae TaxID=3028117 RepID=UPI00168505D8|nr:hypothetical protein [Microcoleus sp. FACHB-1515]MBD2089164.1 hypothetical protein [Microcoleus sp. FACHB-1515]
MQTDYYGISIASTQFASGWRWQVALPIGSSFTSDESFPTAEQALYEGHHWLRVKSAFSALNRSLSEICASGRINQQEYGALMQSFLLLTKHE